MTNSEQAYQTKLQVYLDKAAKPMVTNWISAYVIKPSSIDTPKVIPFYHWIAEHKFPYKAWENPNVSATEGNKFLIVCTLPTKFSSN